MSTPDDPTPYDENDPLAARLRAALTSEADMVTPSDDGLRSIRDGIGASRRPWWQHPAAPALAAAAVLGLMAGGIAVLFSGGDGQTVVAGPGSSTSSAGEPSSLPAPSSVSTSVPPSTSSAVPVPIEGGVYVYYVMDDGQGPRLYREQRPNPGMDPVSAALGTLLSEPALDPDYTSLWEGSTLDGYAVVGDTATVTLAGAARSLSARPLQPLALQQIVYTVTANDPAVKLVRVAIGDEVVSPDDQLARAPMVDVQGLIWLLAPAEGATVSSPVEISGYGTAFEGTVSWEVRKAGTDGPAVAEGFTQAGATGEFGGFTDSVELEPGEYEVRAFESSAKDGSPLHVDSKTFTVG